MQASATIVKQISASATVLSGMRLASAKVNTGGGVLYYEGEYAFTPTEEEQTVVIKGLTARENITIAPIPSNYGRITQIGNILRIT